MKAISGKTLFSQVKFIGKDTFLVHNIIGKALVLRFNKYHLLILIV